MNQKEQTGATIPLSGSVHDQHDEALGSVPSTANRRNKEGKAEMDRQRERQKERKGGK